MSISENIRSLAREGMSVADIARQLNIRYQHAYGVLKAGNMLATTRTAGTAAVETSSRPPVVSKPLLPVEELVKGGFEFSGRWILSNAGELVSDRPVPSASGVYAFAKEGIVVYVGVATTGLASRLYFYGKPGPSQTTNQRLNETIRLELQALVAIEIYSATPSDFDWNGFPVNGSAGLEHGLISKYSLPWNKRSAK